MCWDCWEKREGIGDGAKRPARLITDDLEYLAASCCYCGRRTIAGIIKRQNPRDVPCGGNHPEALKWL